MKKLIAVTIILVAGGLIGLAIWRLTSGTTDAATPLKPAKVAEPTPRAVTVRVSFDGSTCLPMDWAQDGWTTRDANTNDIVGVGTWSGRATAPFVSFQLKASPAFYTVNNEANGLTWGPFDGAKAFVLLSCKNMSATEMPVNTFTLYGATCPDAHWSTDTWTLRAFASRNNGPVLSAGIVTGGTIKFADVGVSAYVVSDDTADFYWVFSGPETHSLSCAE